MANFGLGGFITPTQIAELTGKAQPSTDTVFTTQPITAIYRPMLLDANGVVPHPLQTLNVVMPNGMFNPNAVSGARYFGSTFGATPDNSNPPWKRFRRRFWRYRNE